MPANDSIFDRVWDRLEDRYETDDVGCGCDVSAEAVTALDDSALSREDIAAYRRNEITMPELLADLDLDVDPAAVDGLTGLAEALETTRAGQESG